MRAPGLFSAADRSRIAEAVAAAESVTSAEIRVFIDDRCPGNPIEKAAWVFQKLGMEKTRERNAVLLYLAMSDHRFAVFGDEGVHAKLGQSCWDEVCSQLQSDFKLNRLTQGIETAVLGLGERLKAHFPKRDDDQNELPDAPVF